MRHTNPFNSSFLQIIPQRFNHPLSLLLVDFYSFSALPHSTTYVVLVRSSTTTYL